MMDEWKLFVVFRRLSELCSELQFGKWQCRPPDDDWLRSNDHYNLVFIKKSEDKRR
jgi:hypothetical protein